MEEWRDIPGYEGRFQISNQGRVKSLERKVRNRSGFWTVPEKIIKYQVNSKGYQVVSLGNSPNKKTFKVHRLVAAQFVKNPLNLDQINHLDANKENNFSTNLEWCSTRENCSHRHFNNILTSRFTGVSMTNSGKWNAKAYLNKKRVHLGNFDTQEEARDAYIKALANQGITNKYIDSWQR